MARVRAALIVAPNGVRLRGAHMGLNSIARALAVVLCLFCAHPDARADETVTVFAAASLKNALEEVADRFTEESGVTTRLSFAGSSALARQIAHGAPADVFISANADWMDDLEQEARVDAASRVDLLGNTLVMVGAPTAAGEALDLSAPGSLRERLGDGRLALAFVDAVPAGIYGKAALKALSHWNSVKDSIVEVDNVRAALRLVAAREVPLGIVYATDASAETRVTLVATFPADSHGPIVYPAALVGDEPASAARAFLQFLQSERAQGVFEAHGFVPLSPS